MHICLTLVGHSWPREVPQISCSTFLLSGIWLAFPPSLEVFCLRGRALLVIRPVTTCGLATTFGIAICCNTAIRPEFVRCTLVVCDVKCVCPLSTTLSITIWCNTAIRPESIYCALIAYGQVFVYFLATTLGIVIRYDIGIRPESVRCMLAVIRLLPIFCSFFR